MIPIIRTFQIIARWLRRWLKYGVKPCPWKDSDSISNDQPVPGETVSETLDNLDKEEERQ